MINIGVSNSAMTIRLNKGCDSCPQKKKRQKPEYAFIDTLLASFKEPTN